MSADPILFVGAGRIGMPIVRRMIASGLDVHVSDTSAEALAQLAQQGTAVLARDAISPLKYRRTILCLPDPDAATSLITDWLSHELPKGAVIADITTMAPSTARRHAAMLAPSCGQYLDIPVSGGQRGADSGDMVVIAGGPKSAVDDMLPILRAIGTAVHYAGDVGAASLMKAVNQYVYLSYNLAFAQGLQLGNELGLPDDVVMDVLSKGAAGHPLINDRLPSTLHSGFRDGFLLKRCLKDLDFLEAADGSRSSALEAHERLRREIRQAVEDGMGDRDILILSQKNS